MNSRKLVIYARVEVIFGRLVAGAEEGLEHLAMQRGRQQRIKVSHDRQVLEVSRLLKTSTAASKCVAPPSQGSASAGRLTILPCCCVFVILPYVGHLPNFPFTGWVMQRLRYKPGSLGMGDLEASLPHSVPSCQGRNPMQQQYLHIGATKSDR